ncbi:bromodomain-containing protein 4-like [Planoprotostelium fungivorum]|uniref:Bromodomain-containing protein 4-like n=1 Tax=Planoprotostelium fungivorum TaxID=1890364 RepID=A0A2P6NFH8_9EUKA|nr:bromodomain-containing protein 4-like [Planoprotostelium fungivorum]
MTYAQDCRVDYYVNYNHRNVDYDSSVSSVVLVLSLRLLWTTFPLPPVALPLFPNCRSSTLSSSLLVARIFGPQSKTSEAKIYQVNLWPAEQDKRSENLPKDNEPSTGVTLVGHETDDEPEEENADDESVEGGRPLSTKRRGKSKGPKGNGTPSKRGRNREPVSPEPVSGKRQRKANPSFSGYALDKKTSAIIGNSSDPEDNGEATEKSPKSPKSKTPPPTTKEGKRGKMVVATVSEITEKAKRLPKGYTYEVVPASEPSVLPNKRERRKSARSEFTEDEQEEKEKESPAKEEKKEKRGRKRTKKEESDEEVTPTKGEKKKNKEDKKSKVFTVTLPPSVKEEKKSAPTTPIATPTPPPPPQPDPETIRLAQEMERKKEELENHLKALQTQIAAAEHQLDTRTKQLEVVQEQVVIATSPPPAVHPKKVKSPTFSSTKKKLPKKTRDPYDAYESDEEEEKKMRRRSGPPASTTPQPRQRRPVRPKIPDEYAMDDSQNLTGVMGKVLKRVRNEEWAWPFNSPVDVKALNIPDYLTIIKHPMDLGTVWNSLCNSEYTSPEQIYDHVLLTFQNAHTYNQEGSDIVVMANNLWAKFHSWYSQIETPPPRTLVTPPPLIPPPIVPGVTDLPLDSAPITPRAPSRRTPKNTPNEALKEMTFEEKRELSQSINNFSNENLGRVVEIISQHMPSLAQNKPDEIEIEIDTLDTVTLRALEKYVKSVNSKKNRTRSSLSANRGTPSSHPKKKGAPLLDKTAQLAQVEATQSQTEKHIQDVKDRLNDLQNRTANLPRPGGPTPSNPRGNGKEEILNVVDDDVAPHSDYPSVEIPKDSNNNNSSDSSSSSDSDSDSDSSSSSSDSSDSETEDKAKPSHPSAAPPVVQLVQPPAAQPQSAAPTVTTPPLNAVAPKTPTPTAAHPAPVTPTAAPVAPVGAKAESLPTILQPTIKKEIELKNLSSWTTMGAPPVTTSQPVAVEKKDDTFEQFQNRDLMRKEREKELQEQEEKEKKEKQDREEEEKRKKEEEEERKKREEEEKRTTAQRELDEKRAAERKAREEASRQVNLMDQSTLMADFERMNSMGPSMAHSWNPVIPATEPNREEGSNS